MWLDRNSLEIIVGLASNHRTSSLPETNKHLEEVSSRCARDEGDRGVTEELDYSITTEFEQRLD